MPTISQNISTYKVLGLMSGTSLDGLDLAYCEFKMSDSRWEFEIVHGETVEYSAEFREKLKATVGWDAIKLLAFHNEYGTWLGSQARDFIQKHRLSIDLVASHGHTVFHQPHIGLTLQIGSGQHIANACSRPTIADFRSNDVALGGQGAPLVPIGDKLLFGEYDYCLNLGGICNISFTTSGQRKAYDIAPANMLFSHLLQHTDLPYDDGGNIARSGQLIAPMFAELEALDFYQTSGPKSLGVEWFAEVMVPILAKYCAPLPDRLHTAVHHVCSQIAKAVAKPSNDRPSKMLATGGGAHNVFLIETLQSKLGKSCQVTVGSASLTNFKEALIFAFMGVLRVRHEVNCLASVTGARHDSCSGVLFQPS